MYRKTTVLTVLHDGETEISLCLAFNKTLLLLLLLLLFCVLGMIRQASSCSIRFLNQRQILNLRDPEISA